MVDVFVPKIVKGLNKSRGRHWAYHKRIKDGWLDALRLILRQGEHHNKAQSVRITAYYNSTRNFLDDDNFRGGCKPVVDCLKDLGWIRDDSLIWVHVDYSQKTVGEEGIRETGTRIQIVPQTKVCVVCTACGCTFLSGVSEVVMDGGVWKITGECCLSCGRRAEWRTQ